MTHNIKRLNVLYFQVGSFVEQKAVIAMSRLLCCGPIFEVSLFVKVNEHSVCAKVQNYFHEVSFTGI